MLTTLNWKTFSSNPYFEDKKLTKTYSMSDDGTVTVKATSIKWKAGMVLCLDNQTICLTYQVPAKRMYLIYTYTLGYCQRKGMHQEG